MAVSRGTIIEQFDVIGDLGRGNFPRMIDVLLDPLFLQTAEE